MGTSTTSLLQYKRVRLVSYASRFTLFSLAKPARSFDNVHPQQNQQSYAVLDCVRDASNRALLEGSPHAQFVEQLRTLNESYVMPVEAC